jgi:hypothetical protein
MAASSQIAGGGAATDPALADATKANGALWRAQCSRLGLRQLCQRSSLFF